jgi:glycerate kinase
VSRPMVAAVAQAFKESLSVGEVAAAFEAGIREAGGEPLVLLASDGGDGLLDALAPAVVRWSVHRVSDPLLRPLDGVPIGWLDDGSAVIESRLACGLGLLATAERDPLVTSTRGVGELIAQAVGAGAGTVFVGLGGSATVDGGVGMARAWGWVPRDAEGRELPEGGGALVGLAAMDAGRRPDALVVGVSDVASPLLGPRGARVFASQKGASPEDAERLAAGLERLAEVVGEGGPLGLSACVGAGAAGGLGFGILQFARGRLEAGAAWVLDRVGFDHALAGAALLLLGEGRFDRTSLEGKLTGVALSRAVERGVGVALVAPHAEQIPERVVAETGGGRWDAAELSRRAASAVRRALRLLGP